jgi:hypothetical protein
VCGESNGPAPTATARPPRSVAVGLGAQQTTVRCPQALLVRRCSALQAKEKESDATRTNKKKDKASKKKVQADGAGAVLAIASLEATQCMCRALFRLFGALGMVGLAPSADFPYGVGIALPSA